MKHFRSALSVLAAVACAATGALLVLEVILAPVAPSRTALASTSAVESAPGGLSEASWDEYSYRFLRASCSRRFDVTSRIRPLTKQPGARVIFNVQDKANYYYAQFTGSDVEIGRVESGFITHIGTSCDFGLANGADAQSVIRIKRRGSKITVILDNVIAALAYDSSFSGGRIGCGTKGKSAAFSKLRCQSVGEIYLADDFMRRNEEASGWETVCGRWRTNTLDNPSLSSNAFSYLGSGRGIRRSEKRQDAETFAKDQALAVIGDDFWNDYTFEVACMPRSNRSMGICLYYRDEENYYLFRWDSSSFASPKKQLIKASNGEKTILWEGVGGHNKNQWYQLKAVIYSDTVEIYIDGSLVCKKSDPNLVGGQVGLYAEGLAGAYFDDVLVKDTKTFADDFSVASPGKWVELRGNWSVADGNLADGTHQGEKHDSAFHVDAMNDTAKAVSGDVNWRNYVVSTDLLWGRSANSLVGLCFHYLDELNYYSYEWQAVQPLSTRGVQTKRRLVKTVNGVRTVLAEDECLLGKIGTSKKYRLSAKNNDGHIVIHIDGEAVFEEYDLDLQNGKIGLLAANTSAAFDNVKVDFIEERKPLVVQHEVFSHEKSMEIWAGRLSDWEYPGLGKRKAIGTSDIPFLSNLLNEKPSTVYWHRSDFYRDVEIRIGVDSLESGNRGEIRLALAGDGGEMESGYNLTISIRHNVVASLRRKTELISETPLSVSGYIGEVSLKRSGRVISAYVNKKHIAHFKDSDPLKGTKLAWSASGIDIEPEEVTVLAGNVYHYTFDKANVDWRVASGTWRVTNRWQCDPRWSFFSGRSDRGLAALWNKRKFQGDITLEFYAGPKMERERGSNYSYVSDMNATICADGKDLTSGYSFIYGGWNNTATRIVKGRKTIAETRTRLISSLKGSIHRRWFYFKIRKIGNKLEYYIDNQLVLSCTDEDPLTGDRAAIWTYNNGLMLARVRISSEAGTEKEPPTTYTSKCESVYSYRR